MAERVGRLLVVLLIAAAIAGCTRTPPPPMPPKPETVPERALERLPDRKVPFLIDDADLDSLRAALRESRAWLYGRPWEERLRFGAEEYSPRELAQAYSQIDAWLEAGVSAEQLSAEIAREFEIFVATDEEILVTGYYEPVIEGSLVRREGYEVPIYGPPTGLVRVDLGLFDPDLAGRRLLGLLDEGTLVPFPDRQGIRETGVMRGREIAWAKDRVELFFVEVQGSGSLRLPDGSLMRIGYAGANGRAYRSIGKLLIDEGAIPREQMSMQALRVWLGENPEEIERVLDHNTSQVFFRRLDGPPVGSLGRPVTPGRSIATDHEFYPRGALGFLVSEVPELAADGTTVAAAPLRRFVLNQDRGGAIKSASRVDFFWGRGEQAAARAGAMKQPGKLYFFAPKLEKSERAFPPRSPY